MSHVVLDAIDVAFAGVADRVTCERLLIPAAFAKWRADGKQNLPSSQHPNGPGLGHKTVLKPNPAASSTNPLDRGPEAPREAILSKRGC
ncbi:hypothetical protein PGT21_018220 [Puccinia graminis f. sp. tritici]|uniref:Uncharacterized protein n=1 Tax=Puccinia graminis f. sp. tritici TaxID=56615 RepID=A0A5B0PRZ7_PUCGR|nr:hypothetical protein PGT21_018220 [Puccinia graminis f. sp. tritici]